MLLSWIENEEQKQFWSGNTFKDGVNEEIFSNHLARKDVHSHCYLGETNTLIAYGEIVYSDLSKGVLCRVIVKPNARRAGIGKNFIQDLLNWAFHEKSLKKIILNTYGHNQPALRCYHTLGFREVALKRKFRWVGNRWCDLVVLEKNSHKN